MPMLLLQQVTGVCKGASNALVERFIGHFGDGGAAKQSVCNCVSMGLWLRGLVCNIGIYVDLSTTHFRVHVNTTCTRKRTFVCTSTQRAQENALLCACHHIVHTKKCFSVHIDLHVLF